MTVKKAQKRDEAGDYRYQGIACALGELAAVHGEPDLAGMVLESLGLTIADLKAAGAAEYDLNNLKGGKP